MEELTPPQGSYSPPSSSTAEALRTLLASLPTKKLVEATKFVKILEDIPEISLLLEVPIQVALSLADHALVD